MTVLSALDRYYGRLARGGTVPPYGYSSERISYAVVLAADGTPVDVEPLGGVDARGRHQPQLLDVPASFKRPGTLPRSFFLWDKTSYAVGVQKNKDGGSEPKAALREHAAFKELHKAALGGSDDEGLSALLKFLERWAPEHFSEARFPPEMLNANIVFRLDGERGYLHDRPAAQKAWERMQAEADVEAGLCLVTGEKVPIARLHPAIKGVAGAQSSGTSIVSFNLDAFTSYGKEQGANAPVGQPAAFRYTTALNHLLRRSEHNRQRLQIGEATTVFWAEVPEDGHDPSGEEIMLAAFLDPPAGADTDPPPDEAGDVAKIKDVLAKVAAGRPVKEAAPDLHEETTFHILGLSPNAARLSVRFWLTDTFGALAARIVEHWHDLHLEPNPFRTPPAFWRLLYELAAQRKPENVPAHIAGELTRAVLTGGRYPRSLLTAAIVRLRADRNVNGPRAAMVKACLARDRRKGAEQEDTPVSLDTENTNPGYRLGRLFAVMEAAQYAGIGRVNASISDKFIATASAAPQRVFPLLMRGYRDHISSARKRGRGGRAGRLEYETAQIISGLDADNPYPRTLRLEDQGRFFVGFYHQAAELRIPHMVDATEDEDAESAE